MEANIPHSPYPRIVVVGGGFGGLSLVKALRHQSYQIVLIDKNNYHTFQPLLYQVAVGGIEPDSVAVPYRKILDGYSNVVFRMAEVVTVNPIDHEVLTTIGVIRYDYLVVATGSITNFFQLSSTADNAMPLKSVPQALDMRSLFFQNLEKAVLMDDEVEFESLIDIVIVGGGPTGVEMAGALAELRRHVLPTNFAELDLQRMDIYLVESGDRLLGSMSEQASREALRFLESLGVRVLLNTRVTEYDGRIVMLSNGQQVLSTTLVWAAGVSGNVPSGLGTLTLVPGNRLRVDEYLRVNEWPDVFAIGDVAAVTTHQRPRPHAMVAPVAIQQGKQLARNFVRTLKQKPWKPFKYADRGAMATVGRHRAVVDLPLLRFSGVMAWLVWLMVHLMALVGFRNKLVVFLNWVLSYLSYDYSLHLIIRPFHRKKPAVFEVAA